MTAVVVAIHLHRLVGRRRRAGHRPTSRHVKSLAAEATEEIGLCGGAVDLSFGAPVILGNRKWSAWVVASADPSCHPRNQIDDGLDPAFGNIARIPQLA